MLVTARRIVVNLKAYIHILCSVFHKVNEKTFISLSIGSLRMFGLHRCRE